MNESLHFRQATTFDVEQLIELRYLMQSEVNEINQMNEEELLRYKNLCREYFDYALTNNLYQSFIALDNKKIVATVGVCFYQKPPSLIGHSKGLVGYVTNVYTLKTYRGAGIATTLMKNLIDYAKIIKADKLHLGATEDGSHIYRSVGFSEPRFVNLDLKL